MRVIQGKKERNSGLANSDYDTFITSHYKFFWGASPKLLRWELGPTDELPSSFGVLEFPPEKKVAWIYATCGMSRPEDESPLEIHMYSPCQYDQHVELLTAIAHYHRTGCRLGLGHTVNFGRPWLPGSACDHGLVSLPYLDGPDLEIAEFVQAKLQFYWLIPITKEEREFKKRNGLDALEERLEAATFNYLDPKRKSVI